MIKVLYLIKMDSCRHFKNGIIEYIQHKVINKLSLLILTVNFDFIISNILNINQ
jgi:hypothetical protein